MTDDNRIENRREEMLISGIFYKNSRKYGFRMMREKLEWIKYLRDLIIYSATVIPMRWSPKNACEGYR